MKSGMKLIIYVEIFCCQIQGGPQKSCGAYLLIFPAWGIIYVHNTIIFMKIQNTLIKQNPVRKFAGSLFILLVFVLISTGLYAQETVEINGQDVGSWFERNWMWVTGCVLLLLLIALFSGRSRKSRKTTTVVKDTYGNVKSVTTTEEKP
jgi:protein-S-isoprenylcysteine O-methyltransferase Ste14